MRIDETDAMSYVQDGRADINTRDKDQYTDHPDAKGNKDSDAAIGAKEDNVELGGHLDATGHAHFSSVDSKAVAVSDEVDSEGDKVDKGQDPLMQEHIDSVVVDVESSDTDSTRSEDEEASGCHEAER